MKQRKQLQEKQSELQGVEVALNVEMNSLREKLGDSIRNLETATKEKNTARLKNKETLAKEQNQVQSFK